MDTNINKYISDFTVEKYNIKLSRKDIKVLLQMIAWGQIYIARELKKCERWDTDIKEYYSFYRANSGYLAEQLKKFE